MKYEKLNDNCGAMRAQNRGDSIKTYGGREAEVKREWNMETGICRDRRSG